MGLQESPSPGAYVQLLAAEAKRLQHEARGALEQGCYTRASALIGDAELLAEDIHLLVRDIERHEIGGLTTLAAYDLRDVTLPARPPKWMRFTLPSRRLRMALGTSVAMSLALTEW
jgi:hypothetical protein